jgi:phosphoheptose isomerase
MFTKYGWIRECSLSEKKERETKTKTPRLPHLIVIIHGIQRCLVIVIRHDARVLAVGAASSTAVAQQLVAAAAFQPLDESPQTGY